MAAESGRRVSKETPATPVWWRVFRVGLARLVATVGKNRLMHVNNAR